MDDLNNSMVLYLEMDDQYMMFQNHWKLKDAFKVQYRTLDFNATEYEKVYWYGFRVHTVINL